MLTVSLQGAAVHAEGDASRRPLLRSTDVTLRPGEITLVIGRTGAGKSTLLLALAGLSPLTSGTIRYGETPLWEGDKLHKDALGLMGFSFQYPERQMFAQTLRREFVYSLRPLRLPKEEVRQRTEEGMRTMGLPEALLEEAVLTLSEGQKRRAALAVTLAVKPPWLLLDEPTAGIDPGGIPPLLDAVLAHKRAGGGVVIASHDLDTFFPVADRVIVIRDGAVAGDRPPEAWYADPEPLLAAGVGLPASVRLAAALACRGVSAGVLPADPAAAAAAIRRSLEAASAALVLGPGAAAAPAAWGPDSREAAIPGRLEAAAPGVPGLSRPAGAHGEEPDGLEAEDTEPRRWRSQGSPAAMMHDREQDSATVAASYSREHAPLKPAAPGLAHSLPGVPTPGRPETAAAKGPGLSRPAEPVGAVLPDLPATAAVRACEPVTAAVTVHGHPAAAGASTLLTPTVPRDDLAPASAGPSQQGDYGAAGTLPDTEPPDPVHPWIRRRHPVAKWIVYLLLSAGMLIQGTWAGLGAGALLLTFCLVRFRVPPAVLLKPLRPYLLFLFFACLLAGMQWGPGAADGGAGGVFSAEQASATFLQLTNLALVMMLGFVFVRVTGQRGLRQGLEQVLGLVSRVGIPVGTVSLYAALLLRMIPQLFREMGRMSLIVRSRGRARVKPGQVRLRDVPPFLIPLLLSMMKQAEDLALALEARGCRIEGPSVRRREPIRWDRGDILLLAASGVLFLGLLAVAGWA
ncbi:ATP-binding cassette domain-containing protein [Paenibacillus sp. S-38]|uniref:ATP-binding cassette domain-containing protein n=1 Tax=Paenibacillus sp. S-38 TaxID=3416710 RepID=UPI003CEA8F67